MTLQLLPAEVLLTKPLEPFTRYTVGTWAATHAFFFDIAKYQLIHFRLSPFIGPELPMKLDGTSRIISNMFRCEFRFLFHLETSFASPWSQKNQKLAILSAMAWSVGSAAIPCLHIAPLMEVMHLSFALCLIYPTSHHSASHLSRVSSVRCLICSASHLFCVSSVPCLIYSVSQDLDRFPTLRSCLDIKPRLGISPAWQGSGSEAVVAERCI